MALAYINIGSNRGDREEFIKKAIEKINDKFGVCCISEKIETEPWGFQSSNRFINIGLAFHTDLDPEDLLRDLQGIEKAVSTSAHRDEEGHYIDRDIDIDIMAIDRKKYVSETLILPHLHLLERDFFMEPLKQLAPDWRYPE